MLRLLLVLGITISYSNGVSATTANYDTALLNRSSFPAGFLFGTASSSYQVSVIDDLASGEVFNIYIVELD